MFNNKLKLNASLSGYKQTYFSGSDGGGYNSEVYRNALIYNPTTPVYDKNGNYSESTKNEYFNPVSLLNEVEGENQATNLRMFANITYTPIEGLDIKYLFSSNTKSEDITRPSNTNPLGKTAKTDMLPVVPRAQMKICRN